MMSYKKRPHLWSSDDESTTTSDSDIPNPRKIMKKHCCFCGNADREEMISNRRSKGDDKGCKALSICGSVQKTSERTERSRYEKWNPKVDTAEFLPWYRSRELICALRCIRKINYTDIKDRTAALERLNKLNDAAPFSKYKRFPEHYYVMEGDGPLAKKLQQLRCVLEIKDFPSCPVTDSKDCSAENMCRIFRSCCRMIMGDLVKGDDVYERKKFEKCFEVTWIEVKPKPKPKPKPEPKKTNSQDKQFSDDDDDREDPCKRYQPCS